MSTDGRSVNYVSLKTSSLFKEYKQLVQDLGAVDLTSLTEQTKMAFFISILVVMSGSNVFQSKPQRRGLVAQLPHHTVAACGRRDDIIS